MSDFLHRALLSQGPVADIARWRWQSQEWETEKGVITKGVLSLEEALELLRSLEPLEVSLHNSQILFSFSHLLNSLGNGHL